MPGQGHYIPIRHTVLLPLSEHFFFVLELSHASLLPQTFDILHITVNHSCTLRWQTLISQLPWASLTSGESPMWSHLPVSSMTVHGHLILPACSLSCMSLSRGASDGLSVVLPSSEVWECFLTVPCAMTSPQALVTIPEQPSLVFLIMLASLVEMVLLPSLWQMGPCLF